MTPTDPEDRLMRRARSCRQRVWPLLTGAIVGLPIAACQPTPAQRGIEATRVAKLITTSGTSVVMGSVRVPPNLVSNHAGGLVSSTTAGYRIAGIAAPVVIPHARIRLLDGLQRPIAGMPTLDSGSDGVFSFPGTPLGSSMIVEAWFTDHGETLTMRAVIRPSESLTCAHVDLATTMLTDKLISKQPLFFPDPGLQGADLFDLFDPGRFDRLVASLRTALADDSALTPAEVRAGLINGDTSAVLNKLVNQAPDLGTSYQQAFERPDSSLGLKVAAIAKNTAPVPGKEGPVVFGILHLKVTGAPDDTERVEYVIDSKVATTSVTPPAWEADLNTWALPNGPTTMESVSIHRDGRRDSVNRTYMVIRNTLQMHCPYP